MICITLYGVARTLMRSSAFVATLFGTGVVLTIGPLTSAAVSADTHRTVDSQAWGVPFDRDYVADVDSIEMHDADECEPAWVQTFGGHPGLDHLVYDLTVFDDGSGSGPAMYAGGAFKVAGGVEANYIAKWDGTSWSPLGTGMNGTVIALAVFDDGLGGGPALYAGGDFVTAGGETVNHIAKWDGASWSPLGTGLSGGEFPGSVLALAVFDDGSGPALYAGGNFTLAGGVEAKNLAKWDGISWSPLDTEVSGVVRALMVVDDGDGLGGSPALYVGGEFWAAGDEIVRGIAKWDGSMWSPLGAGVTSTIHALEIFDDGSGGGPGLFAGGGFIVAGGVSANRIAKWDGTDWSPLGSGMNGIVRSLTVFDDGSGGGPVLYAGGNFTTAGGVEANYIAKWDGTSWSPLGTGLATGVHPFVASMTVFDDGSSGGPALYTGGRFLTAGKEFAKHVAKWDGTSWSPVETGISDATFDHTIAALVALDDESRDGPNLYAGGRFATVNGVAANHVAKWDGESWSPLGTGMSGGDYLVWVNAVTVFDDGLGRGPSMYAGGNFTSAGGVEAKNIAKWDGESWSPLGTGMALGISISWVRALAVFDDGLGGGPALFAGGWFSTAGGVSANHIAKWDGSTWSPVGGGINGTVTSLTVFDDGSGSGPALYAGGDFVTAGGGETVNHIAKWDGESWSPVGTGMSGPGSITILALTVFDDGSGPALYAGGWFANAGGETVSNIAKWDGTAWSPLGTGMNYPVRSLTVFDDGSGSGPALYAGGNFTTAGGVSANHIAKWDGESWSPLGAGMSIGVNPFVLALAVFDDGSDSGPALYAGGSFAASPAGDSYLAKWQGCPVEPPCATADFNCDGEVNVTDLLMLLSNWGPCIPKEGSCQADLNGDGEVNVSDLLILLSQWG